MHELFKSNSFVWWQGVVEDRKDPQRLGRCRVRVFGYHDKDKNLIPTTQLPWASPVTPVNSASTSGIGETPVGPVPGTHVFGFFRDGENAQMPVIMGTIPGIPEDAPDVSDPSKAGYQDPGERYPLDSEEHGLNESDVTRLARHRWEDEDGAEQTEEELPPVVQNKIDNRVTNVPVANGHGSYSEPPTAFDAKYPYNHVITSESGHIIERDDTPGKERTHDYHRSGTFTEIFPFGTKVTKIVRDNYEFVLGDKYVNIKKTRPESGTFDTGNLFINIEGDVYESVQGNVERQINGTLTENIRGDYNTYVHGNRTIGITGNYAESIQGDMTVECYNETIHTRGKSNRYSEDEVTVDTTKNLTLRTEGGNLGLYSIPHAGVPFLAGMASGNILMNSGNALSITTRSNFNVFAAIGSINMNAAAGTIELAANRSMLMKTAAGEMILNAATTLDVISGMNQTYQTSALCTQRFGSLDTLIDLNHLHQSPSYTRKTDYDTITTSTRIVTGNTLTEVFKNNIEFLSQGDYFMGSNGDMQINSSTNINITTGAMLNLN
ncbi:MAG TPA: hypothetical protein DCX27_17125 [Balneola sp.]|nr:hypothetical protein [Balneola sp.]